MAASKAIMDGLQVSYIEAYTPSASQITSSALSGRQLEFAYFMLAADGTITVQCYGGNTETLTVKGGIVYPVAVKKITAASGTVYILHNGK